MRRTPLGSGIVAVLVLALILSAPAPAKAMEKGKVAGAAFLWTLGTAAVATFAYIAWVNRPGNPHPPDWSLRGPGGVFLGAFMGASFTQSYPWSYTPYSLPSIPYSVSQTSNTRYQPGVVGGLKLGYFFHRFPYLGIEGEFNLTRNDLKRQEVTLNRPLWGSTKAIIQSQNLLVMTLGIHILGRVGFLKDEEVPFGRLQPYVGIGPGVVYIFGEDDSSKNLSLEVLAGVRYMLLKNLSAFVEYKFSHQWQVELEHQKLWQPGGPNWGNGFAKFDYTNHKVVFGICYHFW
jgi:opacity protein-like surface antigen